MTNVISSEPLTFKRLLPVGPPATGEEIVECLGLHARGSAVGARDEREKSPTRQERSPTRPYLVLNMISTIDGRASIGGRSGPIGNRADRELFHGLRSTVDAVLVGAGTVRTERYGRLIADESRRQRRRERGLAEEPLAAIVSGRLNLPGDIPLLADPSARVVIVTASASSLPASGAQIEYIRSERDGQLDLPAALTELHERYHVRTLLCEGGPHLNAQLLAAGLVDELLLCIAPILAGADADSKALGILAGAPFQLPAELDLVAALENASYLFLRYRVRSASPSPAPV